MGEFDLSSNEYIIIQNDRVKHGGLLAVYTDSLVLTNLNLVYIKKNLFNKTEDVQYYPLSSIKNVNGHVQAILGKSKNGMPELQLYFLNGQEQFGFESKVAVQRFVENITKIVTGKEHEIDTSKNMPQNEFEVAGEMLKEGFATAAGAFQGAFGTLFGDEKIKQTKKTITKKCSNCGATLTGMSGSTVTCNYCGSKQSM